MVSGRKFGQSFFDFQINPISIPAQYPLLHPLLRVFYCEDLKMRGPAYSRVDNDDAVEDASRHSNSLQAL
jgi:hypothetical protein